MEIDINKIYDNRTRQYFQEVLSCYQNGCYRSAIVILNSVCLSDLFYKLQELRDVYSDSIAAETLKKIDQQIAKDKTSPGWERTLVESIFNNLHLLDSAGYTFLVHLHDYRNLTAHPVLDGSSDLYQPTKELVESCILEAYNNILVKPSIFVKNIVDFISNDLDSKKGHILLNKDEFAKYICKKYFIHMSDAMVLKVLHAFWKFTYVITDNPDCINNRRINYSLVLLIVDTYKKLAEEEIENNSDRYGLADNKATIMYMIILLAFHPSLFNKLSAVTRNLILQKIEGDNFYTLISWFTSPCKSEHIDKLILNGFHYLPEDKSRRQFLNRIFTETGDTDPLLKYYINTVRLAGSFDSVIKIMDNYILPNISKMNKTRLEELIDAVNTNNQIYHNFFLHNYCARIWGYAKRHFTQESIKRNYPRFVIPE